MQKLYKHLGLLAVSVAALTLGRNLADYKSIPLGMIAAVLGGIGAVVFAVFVIQDLMQKGGSSASAPSAGVVGPGIGAPILPVPTFQITFDYLPKSPLTEGWKRGYGQEGPTFSKWSATPRGMTMTQNQCYAMDYALPQFARLCNHVEFTAQFVSDVIIYLDVEIIKKDKSSTNSFWFAHVIGVKAPIYLSEYQEWKFHISPVNNRFLIDLRDEVNEVVGKDGFEFAELKKIRLRGSLSISPILFRQIS